MSEYLQFERIEQYLDGTLEAQEKANFEKELAQSTELQEQLARHRAERAMLNQLYVEHMRKKMQIWEQEFYPPEAPLKAQTLPWRPIMLWTSLALTGILFIWWLAQESAPSEPSPQKPDQKVISDTSPEIVHRKDTTVPPPVTPPPTATTTKPIPYKLLAARYEQPPTNLKGSSGNDFDSVKIWIREKNYEAAILSLERKEILKSNEKMALAYAYFKNKQYPKATELYQTLDAAGKAPYAQQAQWYICLVLLEQMPYTQKQLKEALEYIIQQTNHAYRSQALELQKELRFK